MDNTAILGHLEALAHTLGIEIRYEQIENETAFFLGGLCRIKNKHVIIVNANAATKDKVNTLSNALRRFDLKPVYLIPALRDFLERPKIV